MVCCSGTTQTQVRPMSGVSLDLKIEKGMSVTQCDSAHGCPMKGKRSCQDAVFIILFLGAMGVMGYFAFLGFTKGNPGRLINGMDSWGNVCGQKNGLIEGASYTEMDHSQKPYTFYFNPLMLHNASATTVVCVKECPATNIPLASDIKPLFDNEGIHICEYGVDPSLMESEAGNMCPSTPYFASAPILNRCVPASLMGAIVAQANSANGILSTIDDDFSNKFVSDVIQTYDKICYLMAIAFVVSFVFCLGFGQLAAVLIWITYIVMILGTGAAIGYVWYKHDQNTKADPPFTDDYKQKWLACCICVTIGGTILLLLLLVMRKRIKLVVQLFSEAGKAIKQMPSLMLQPVITTTFLLSASVGMVCIFLYMITAGDPKVTNGRVEIIPDQFLWWARWYHVLMTLWVIQFVLACQEFVIASSVALWFFCRDKSTLLNPVAKSVYNLVRYQLGTVMFGSLIIALVQLVRVILAYIQARLQGRAGPVVAIILKCMACFLWCLEKFLKYINRNAYIECAIYNCGFCKGARKAVYVLVAHALRVMAINSIGGFVLFMGKLAIVAGVVGIGLVFFIDAEEVHYTWVPLLLTAVFTYFIASCFMGVYEMTIDAMFICFCEDLEHNDGVRRPYYMSKGLMQLIDGYEKANDAEAAKKSQKNKTKNASSQRKLYYVDPDEKPAITAPSENVEIGRY